MRPYYEQGAVTIYHGDCLDVLRDLEDASIDAVVTDPPYGLANTTPEQVADTLVRWVNGDRDYLPGGAGFMGKSWDAFVPPVAVWDECLRVLKPGGHLLAFAGSRTFDLMALGIRLAGFDVRDSIAWLYGSGFPKSLDVSKAIDKARDDTSDREAVGAWLRAQREARGLKQKEVAAHWPSVTGGLTGCVANWEGGFNCPTWEQWGDLKRIVGFGDEMDAEVWRLNGRKGTPGEAWGQREVIGTRTTGIGTGRGAVAYIADSDNRDITAPATDAAKAWEGWGTALKPAFEPVVVARKPLAGTVAGNVLAHGTGALNIDGARVGDGSDKGVWPITDREHGTLTFEGGARTPRATDTSTGRWPANVVLDESQAEELDRQSGVSTSRASAGRQTPKRGTASLGDFAGTDKVAGHEDSGGASRFFPTFRYEAKAPTSERPKAGEVQHPTVKPLDLMRWLVRLVTPPNGVILEPFAGSGTTVEAAVLEGFRCVAIEREADYLPLIEKRLSKPMQQSLFGDWDEDGAA